MRLPVDDARHLVPPQRWVREVPAVVAQREPGVDLVEPGAFDLVEHDEHAGAFARDVADATVPAELDRRQRERLVGLAELPGHDRVVLALSDAVHDHALRRDMRRRGGHERDVISASVEQRRRRRRSKLELRHVVDHHAPGALDEGRVRDPPAGRAERRGCLFGEVRERRPERAVHADAYLCAPFHGCQVGDVSPIGTRSNEAAVGGKRNECVQIGARVSVPVDALGLIPGAELGDVDAALLPESAVTTDAEVVDDDHVLPVGGALEEASRRRLEERLFDEPGFVLHFHVGILCDRERRDKPPRLPRDEVAAPSLPSRADSRREVVEGC